MINVHLLSRRRFSRLLVDITEISLVAVMKGHSTVKRGTGLFDVNIVNILPQFSLTYCSQCQALVRIPDLIIETLV